MPTVAEIITVLERIAPPSTAASWDNVGLLLGNETATVLRLMTCLTVTSAVVAEAVAEQVEMIVSHHPLLFRGVKSLSSRTSEGRLLGPLLSAGVAVYSPHTAFDNCQGGINDGLCKRLGLTQVRPLRPWPSPPQFKLVVFVPDADLARVADALFAAGAGVIGQYEQCSFRLAGTGTFFGSEATNPTVGQKGRREEVSEWRLELVVPESRLAAALNAMRAAHSYEEPAFDVYPLKSLPGTGGEGRIGELSASLSLAELASRVKAELRASLVQRIGDPQRPIRRVAVACGAAGEFLTDAIQAQADLFLTGELRFHDALRAEAAGIAVLLPGHYASERPGVEDLAAELSRQFPELNVWASRSEQDPLALV